MQGIEFEFSWPVAENYEIRRIQNSSKSNVASRTILGDRKIIEPFKIVARGDVMWKRLPEKLPLYAVLLGTYRRFEAEPDRLQKTALEFAGQYGLLYSKSGDRDAELLDDWQHLIDTLLTLQKNFEAGRWELNAEKLDIANIRVALVPDPLTYKPRLTFSPSNLTDAIALQFCHRISRGATIRPCLQCGRLFECGLEGKRGDAKFCAKACRFTYNNARRRTAKA